MLTPLAARTARKGCSVVAAKAVCLVRRNTRAYFARARARPFRPIVADPKRGFEILKKHLKCGFKELAQCRQSCIYCTDDDR
jgi:hypothetical protein